MQSSASELGEFKLRWQLRRKQKRPRCIVSHCKWILRKFCNSPQSWATAKLGSAAEGQWAYLQLHPATAAVGCCRPSRAGTYRFELICVCNSRGEFPKFNTTVFPQGHRPMDASCLATLEKRDSKAQQSLRCKASGTCPWSINVSLCQGADRTAILEERLLLSASDC